MKLPALNELQKYREMIDAFGGYNHNLRIGNGEFYDMKNLTSDHYPILSPRQQRGIYVPEHEGSSTPIEPLGIITKDSLCYVERDVSEDTATFYIDGYPIDFGSNNKLSATPKSLISMGSYVIIMPDKFYVNTENYADKGSIEKTVEVNTGSVKFSLCKIDSEEYKIAQTNKRPAPPENPENKELWLDTSDSPHVLKQYSTTSNQWVSIPTTYIKIEFPSETRDLTTIFSDNDGLKIEGLDKLVANNDTLSDVIKEQIKTLNSTMVAWKVGKTYIIVTGIIDMTSSLGLGEGLPTISIKRQMPIMDFIIESGNRLWGCHYGTAHNGQVVNEIYASKLGDFKNWNTFAKISTDSYVASVGTDGAFTGAITHNGYPVFFKENYLHKVYGNYPANYQIQTIACRGVQDGCAKSLAIVNEILYYKSRSSICAYDGSLPVEISSALGDISYSNAAAGVLGNKYYISMMDSNGKYSFFAYDTKKGMWHREDETQATAFCNCRGDLYYIDYGNKQIRTVRGTGNPDPKAIEWEAISGVIGTDSPDKKYISQLDVRMMLRLGSEISFYAEYDSGGEWEHIFSMTGTALRSFPVSIRPRRCDHLRLRIAGVGEAKIYSICKTIEQGSEY